MPYKPPKTIIRHPAVQDCEDAVAIGFNDREGGRYCDRHAVKLRPGWRFTGIHDQDGVRTEARFRTVRDFLDARPVRYETGAQPMTETAKP